MMYALLRDRRIWLALGMALALLVLAALMFNISVNAQVVSTNAAEGATDPTLYQANLSGANEVPPNDSPASGQAILALDADMSSLHYRVMVNEIAGITAAHIHLAPSGENGPVVFWLYDATGVNGPGGSFGPGHPISGTLSLTSENVDDLMAGNYYINAHTPGVPSGEVRGQIAPYTAPEDYNALLSGSEEVPEVETDAAGAVQFTLVNTTTLEYEIGVSDIMSITMSHIHKALPGQNGSVKHWLYDRTGNNAPGGPFDPDNPIMGMVTLNAWDLVDLLTGYFYVNVHTESVPSGEIRGQILMTRLYRATLSGANEVPPVVTAASGESLWALSADTEELHFRVMVDDIDGIMASHIHVAPPGENGPVVHWLYDSTSANAPGGDFGPGAPISGTLAMSDDDLYNLARGNLYINVHTGDVPSGEVRGQLEPFDASGNYGANLSGADEVPPVETDADGLARFYLNSGLSTLHYRIDVNDIIGIGASHIHTRHRFEIIAVVVA